MKRITQVLFLLAALPVGAATLYTGDGSLSGELELTRWYLNRCRYAPEREADALMMVNTSPGGHPDYDACEDGLGVNDFGTTTNAWAAWVASKPPLAPNARLSMASHKHALDLAENQTLSHYSPSTNYYPLNSPPGNRMTAEGYAWTTWGENLAAGFWTMLDAHNALFVDGPISNRGHRINILNASVREIGLGFAETNTWYQQYYSQDYSRTSTNHYFTDTIFYDANTNCAYDEGEGVGGVEIHLWNGSKEALWYDRSEASGNFAVPINDLPDKSNIWVEIRNTAAVTNVTIPLGYSMMGSATLANGASLWFGTYAQPIGSTNVGFRNVTPWTDEKSMICRSNAMELSFSSLRGASYVLEYADGFLGTWRTWTTTTARAETTTFIAPLTMEQRNYRINILKD